MNNSDTLNPTFKLVESTAWTIQALNRHIIDRNSTSRVLSKIITTENHQHMLPAYRSRAQDRVDLKGPIRCALER